MKKENPFWITTPEDISAEEAIELFVDIFSDFPDLEGPAHSFLHGPRGSGKSMMFRMMRPDCATKRKGVTLEKLKNLSIYVPIKKNEISKSDLEFLDDHPARYVLGEHLLCLYFSVRTFLCLASDDMPYSDSLDESCLRELRNFAQSSPVASSLGVVDAAQNNSPSSVADAVRAIFKSIAEKLQAMWNEVERFIKKLAMDIEKLKDYDGELFAYHSFLLPIWEGLKELSFLPSESLFILVDDADELSYTQTQILNGWVSTRTTSIACIKASTQLRYKTYRCFNGSRIESTHDFQEISISELYTAKKSNYFRHLKQIIECRLRVAGINVDAESFFPEKKEQVESIARIYDQYLDNFKKGKGKGSKLNDDAYRYARPDYIADLSNRQNYSYSGFSQLANISSGVVRWFLQPASTMYTDQKQSSIKNEITHIDPAIQDLNIRKYSSDFIHRDFKSMASETLGCNSNLDEKKEAVEKYRRLEFLINAMGRTFSNLLVDRRRSERRVYSIALSNPADDEVAEVLQVGVAEGYFYQATIGSKSGYGRVPLYVLSRRLAPYFTLDPTSFSGYLFVTNENLRKAMMLPNQLLRDLQDNPEDVQLRLSIEECDEPK